MSTPRSLNEQRMVHCRGEVSRGCGVWPFLESGATVEPPFEPFTWSAISEWDLALSGFDAPYQGRFIDRLKRLFLPARATRLGLDKTVWQRGSALPIVRFRPYHGDEVSSVNAEQLL